MRKLLNNPKVVAALALGAVGAVGFSVWSEMKPPAVQTSAAPAEPVQTFAEPEADPDFSAAERPVDEGWTALAALAAKPRRDPFALPRGLSADVAEAELPDVEETVQLSAVWSQAGRTLVLLNGRICGVGDKVGRVSIERASDDGVWLRHWKGSEFLKVGSRIVLRTPARMLATVSTE